MSRLERRVENLEQASGAGFKPLPRDYAEKVMEALRRIKDETDFASEEEYLAYEKKRIADAPVDSHLGRMRDMATRNGFDLFDMLAEARKRGTRP